MGNIHQKRDQSRPVDSNGSSFKPSQKGFFYDGDGWFVPSANRSAGRRVWIAIGQTNIRVTRTRRLIPKAGSRARKDLACGLRRKTPGMKILRDRIRNWTWQKINQTSSSDLLYGKTLGEAAGLCVC